MTTKVIKTEYQDAVVIGDGYSLEIEISKVDGTWFIHKSLDTRLTQLFRLVSNKKSDYATRQERYVLLRKREENTCKIE